MKISIGSKIVDGPFGGGNEFLKNLITYLEESNHQVINHLRDLDIDIVLLTNPLIDSETSTYNNYDIDYYLSFKNPSCITFQRINECDERKNTNYINSKISKLNKNIDINIYVSDWLKEIYEDYDLNKKRHHVIKGGPDEKIFNNQNKVYWDKKTKLKVVTHHWSSNWMKGFDVYRKLDQLLSKDYIKQKLEFTYIGNLPKNFTFQNTNVIRPLGNNELANELKLHHVYITGSINEPSGNHHMEAAMSGLPILYNDSGALPEYCNDFGVVFNIETLEDSINLIIEEYDNLIKKLDSYPYTLKNAAKTYIDAFETSLEEKENIKNERKKQIKIIILMRLLGDKAVRLLYSLMLLIKINLGRFKRKVDYGKS
tara:strand:- start:1539 stop:2648 length:1110 start_codon:yes stop_codon:yes gene_type:complete